MIIKDHTLKKTKEDILTVLHHWKPEKIRKSKFTVSIVSVDDLAPVGSKTSSKIFSDMLATDLWLTCNVQEKSRGCVQKHTCEIFNTINIVEKVIILMMVCDYRWWHDSYWRSNARVQSIVCTQQGIFASQQAGCGELPSPDYTASWWRHQMETFRRYWPFVWGFLWFAPE